MSASPPPQEDPTYGEIVWDQFRKRVLGFGALWGVLALLALAVYAPLLASNKPFLWDAGEGLESPWLKSLFDRNFYENSIDVFFNALLVFGTPAALGALVAWRRAAGRARLDRNALRRRALQAAAAFFTVGWLAVLAWSPQAPKTVYPDLQERIEADGGEVLAIYPPVPWSYRDGDLDEVREPISGRHWLGTDNAGRDVFTRMLYGTRISLTIGVFAVAIYVTLGVVLGSLAGYYGGRVDAAILRLVEVVICVPSLFLILTVASFIEERSIFHIMLIIALVRWTGPARLVRGEFLRLRGLDYVAAARAAGYREATIIFRELLPNALGPVLVSATFGVAAAILIESTMSFLGLGDITVPSWGQILNTGRTTGMWVLILAPGFAIFVTVSLLNLVGEGVRDALDPKLRQ